MKRRGFALIYAITVVVALASIASFALYTSSLTAKQVADEHIRIQLKLYMESALEYTLLWISGDQSRSQTPGSLGFTFDGDYDVNVSITPMDLSHIAESNGTVLLDAVGRTTVTGETIRITKRTVQKP